MKTYKAFIAESPMTHLDALKLFGYSDTSFTLDDLKATYKKLAIKHHPDKGGDLEAMKRVNIAYDLLSSNSITVVSQHSREDRDKRAKKYATITLNAVESKFDPEIFIKHFESIFGESFSVDIKTSDLDKSRFSNGVTLSASFYNTFHNIVLDLNITVDFLSLYGGAGLSTGELGLEMLISTSILYDRRKVKLSNKNYSFNSDYGILSNPESLFPKNKISTRKEKESKRKMAKRDVILVFQKELKAKWDNKQWLYIPITDDYVLQMWRSTMMGAASWGVNGLYKKYTKISDFPIVYFYEEEDIINWLVDELKGIQGTGPESAMIESIKNIINSYKTRDK